MEERISPSHQLCYHLVCKTAPLNRKVQSSSLRRFIDVDERSTLLKRLNLALPLRQFGAIKTYHNARMHSVLSALQQQGKGCFETICSWLLQESGSLQKKAGGRQEAIQLTLLVH
jgi:hypothetical protein